MSGRSMRDFEEHVTLILWFAETWIECMFSLEGLSDQNMAFA
jgi:hypothetical protein